DHAIAAHEARVLSALGRHAEALRVLDRVLAYGGGLSAALLSAVCWNDLDGACRRDRLVS
ncbi:MAG: hypothetical protein WCJ30_17545, partial [Deltaproteobacteria bacterium]